MILCYSWNRHYSLVLYIVVHWVVVKLCNVFGQHHKNFPYVTEWAACKSMSFRYVKGAPQWIVTTLRPACDSLAARPFTSHRDKRLEYTWHTLVNQLAQYILRVVQTVISNDNYYKLDKKLESMNFVTDTFISVDVYGAVERGAYLIDRPINSTCTG